MIVLFDSNVWISGFQFGGTPLAALRLAYQWDRIAICNEIWNEVSSTLVHKFHWSNKRLADAFADFSDRLTHLSLSGRLHGVCRDPDDDLIVECAVLAGAEIIVTGDEDLLTIRKYRDIRIFTPREFLDEFAAQIGV